MSGLLEAEAKKRQVEAGGDKGANQHGKWKEEAVEATLPQPPPDQESKSRKRAASGFAGSGADGSEAKKRRVESGGDKKSNAYKKSVEAKLPQPISDQKQTKPRKRRSRDDVGQLLGVSGRQVAKAKRVGKANPELLQKVKDGKISLNAAEKEVKKIAWEASD